MQEFDTLYGSIGVLALASVLGSAPAAAQDAQNEDDIAEEQGAIVVTGTRLNDLKAADAALPIDIIAGDELIGNGASDMNDLLRTEVPALNIQRLVSNDGAVFTRPFSLRGLPTSLILGDRKVPTWRQFHRSPRVNLKFCAMAPRLFTDRTRSPRSIISVCAVTVTEVYSLRATDNIMKGMAKTFSYKAILDCP